MKLDGIIADVEGALETYLRMRPQEAQEAVDRLRILADAVADAFAWATGPWMEPAVLDVLALGDGRTFTVRGIADGRIFFQDSAHVIDGTEGYPTVPLRFWQQTASKMVQDGGRYVHAS